MVKPSKVLQSKNITTAISEHIIYTGVLKELVPMISFNFQQINRNIIIVLFSCEGTYRNFVHFFEEHERFYLFFFRLPAVFILI